MKVGIARVKRRSQDKSGQLRVSGQEDSVDLKQLKKFKSDQVKEELACCAHKTHVSYPCLNCS